MASRRGIPPYKKIDRYAQHADNDEQGFKMQKLDIICPFCLETLKGWKVFTTEIKTYSVLVYDYATGHVVGSRSKKSLEFQDEKAAREFERMTLQKHLDRCNHKSYISNAVKEQYKLV